MPNDDQSSDLPDAWQSEQSNPAEDSLGLARDIACPECEYNLRGLGSGDVTCPECGAYCNITQLLTRKWDKPWYRAPGYSKISLPAGWLILAGLVLLPLAIVDTVNQRVTWGLMFGGWLLGMILVWSLLAMYVYRSMGGAQSIGYVMLSHIALGGYLIGVPLFIWGLVWMITQFFDLTKSSINLNAIDIGWSGLLMLTGGLLFALGRWIERVIARYCIKLYLNRAPT